MDAELYSRLRCEANELEDDELHRRLGRVRRDIYRARLQRDFPTWSDATDREQVLVDEMEYRANSRLDETDDQDLADEKAQERRWRVE